MFAKSRMVFTSRVFLTAVIFFNAIAPTLASAKSSLSDDSVVSLKNEIAGKSATVSLAENDYRQRFARPITQENESEESDFSLAQTSGFLLKCVLYFTDYCSDATPNTVLTQFGTTSPQNDFTAVSFKILCDTWGCSQRDIYYRATMEVSYIDHRGTSYEFRASLEGRAGGGLGTNSLTNVLCGYGPSGSCILQTSGVIPAEFMSSDPNQNRHFLIYAYASSAEGTSNIRKVTV